MLGRPTEAEASTVRSGLRADVEALQDRFELASKRAGVVERDLVLGGLRVRLRAAGHRLLNELWPSVAHRSVSGPSTSTLDGSPVLSTPGDDAADLTIALWDSASTGVPLPDIPWMVPPDGEEEDPKTIRVARGDGLRMSYRASERELVALDGRANHAVLWMPDPEGVSVHVRGAPFLVILHWWMRSRGAHPIHAGAVGRPGGGVLLVGRGGSGKSTTSITCMLDGMSYASDDYVMMLGSSEAPYAASVYCTAKLDPTQAARFPELQPALRGGSPPGEKVLAFMHEFMPERVTAGFPIRAVVAPRVSGLPTTTVQRLRPAEALAALAPSTLLHLPLPDPTAFAAMAEAVRRVPSFRLELGTNLSTIPPAVDEVLESA